ncbi:MAG: insulinase family protein [Bacteroidales bacterium]
MKKITLYIATVLFLINTSNAQIDRTIKPLPGPPPKIEIGSYQKQVLPNGLTVILVENHKIPKVTYNMVIEIDPVLEGEMQGYIDMAGSLLGTGSKTRTKDQINDQIDFIGARVGYNSKGFFASCLKKHNETMLELISDALINANFTQEELDKIKKQTLSGLAAEKTDPNAISDRINKLVVFGKDHPYGNSMSENSVSAITLDNCKEYYNTYLHPNKAYLAIIGDITMNEAMPLITRYFGSWEKKEIPSHQFAIPKAPIKNTIALCDRPTSVQSVVKVSYPIPYKVGDDKYIKARVMNTILGGGTFRLFNNLREKHGYTYGSYSQMSPDKYVGNFVATAEVRNNVTDSAIVQILYEMQRMITEDVPQEELSMVKNYVSGSFALSLEKPETVANFALNIERYGLPRDYYENYLSNIAAITSEDIKQAAREYLKPSNSNIVVVGKAEEIAPALTALTPGTKIRYFDSDGNEYDPSKKITPAPAGVTAESVNEKYLEAIGGRKKMEKVNDITMAMSTSMQGMTMNFKNYRKSPNKLLVEISMGGSVVSKQIFDGTKGFVTSPMGSEEATGEALTELKNEAQFLPELNYAANGMTLNLLGIENVKDKPAYKIEITMPSGKKATSYYDVNTYLKVRDLTDQGSTDFSDYRDVKGIKFPFVMEAEIQGQSLKLQIESVEVNTKLKDDLFKI